jgi:glutaminyl-tRNA synthetase
MPPKYDPNSPEAKELVALFQSVGLSEKSAADLARQPKSASPFKALIEEFNLKAEALDEKTAGTLVKLSGAYGKLALGEKGYAVQKVLKGDLKTPDQVAGASLRLVWGRKG